MVKTQTRAARDQRHRDVIPALCAPAPLGACGRNSGHVSSPARGTSTAVYCFWYTLCHGRLPMGR